MCLIRISRLTTIVIWLCVYVWALSDLSKLTVRLKNEFNASKTDLMNEGAKIISS